MSSDRLDVDLSVCPQMRALRDYGRSNGYSAAREYVDETESGRVDNRVLKCASAASANYWVTGDRLHFLPHGKHEGVEILSAPGFCRWRTPSAAARDLCFAAR